MNMNIQVGGVTIGGGRIPVQTMIKNPVTDVDATVGKIERLAALGCDIIRISVPDRESAAALKSVLAQSRLPVVADIHFDHRLAILAAEAGVHKVRINPGNIGDASKVARVIDCLKAHGIPARIGINGGSLPKNLSNRRSDPVGAMIEAARREIAHFEDRGHEKIVISFKSSSVMTTIAVNRLARKVFPYPLHIGVTEAGDLMDGAIKNAAGISVLLAEHIGNTIRVSLTAPEEDEVRVALKILEAAGRREPVMEIISCPTCGRSGGDIQAIVASLKGRLAGVSFPKKLKIAVMGCVVNGPGEAEHADFGVACGKGSSIIFRQGKKLKTVGNDAILDELGRLADEFIECGLPAESTMHVV